MIKFRQKIYSGKGTQVVYRVKRALTSPNVPNIKVMRDTIKTKQGLEKAGHALADRYAIGGAIAGPVIPVPVVSQGLGAAYIVSPKTVKAIPGFGKLVGKVEESGTVKKLGKPAHKAVDSLFKAGKHEKV